MVRWGCGLKPTGPTADDGGDALGQLDGARSAPRTARLLTLEQIDPGCLCASAVGPDQPGAASGGSHLDHMPPAARFGTRSRYGEA
jgi:hypothetical protein